MVCRWCSELLMVFRMLFFDSFVCVLSRLILVVIMICLCLLECFSYLLMIVFDLLL